MEKSDARLSSKMPQTLSMKKPNFANTTINKNEKLNWYIHILFIRQEYEECLKLIED